MFLKSNALLLRQLTKSFVIPGKSVIQLNDSRIYIYKTHNVLFTFEIAADTFEKY